MTDEFATKQVIVVRTDLGMGAGKIAAQASHASMAVLTRDITEENIIYYDGIQGIQVGFRDEEHGGEVFSWITSSFAKVVVAVSSEQELLKVHQAAIEAGLVSHLITDSGRTVFNGVPTHTCLGIGPHYVEKFKGVTDHLPLLK